VRVENLSDDLWIGVKGQPNSEIARTPRNAFRCSVEACLPEVKLLKRLGGFTAYQPLTNSECRQMDLGSEPQGAKVMRREGNNPDQQLRSLSRC
jgi:hypothetical protein